MDANAVRTVVTCNACRVELTGDSRREHYRTEYHRVNLQRKVAGLPPLSRTEFSVRNEAALREEDLTSARRAPRYCAVCSKKFSSQRALENHVASRRHRDTVRARRSVADNAEITGSDVRDSSETGILSDSVSVISRGDSEGNAFCQAETDSNDFDDAAEFDMERRISEAVPFAANECVFDGLVCESDEANVEHMRSFGFFIPFSELLSDRAGLLEYLGQKVGIGYACVECDRPFRSVAAAQHHMVAKQHCRMTSDESVWFEEYGRFYSFAAEAPDEEDEDWEEVTGEEAVAAEIALEASDAGNHSAVVEVECNRGREASHDKIYDETEEEDVALVLGGSKVVGHRSLRRYYRQHIRGEDKRDAVVVSRAENDLRVMGWHRSNPGSLPLQEARMDAFKRNKRMLEVGMKNYHTRKAPLKVPFATFNSGYRP